LKDFAANEEFRHISSLNQNELYKILYLNDLKGLIN